MQPYLYDVSSVPGVASSPSEAQGRWYEVHTGAQVIGGTFLRRFGEKDDAMAFAAEVGATPQLRVFEVAATEVDW